MNTRTALACTAAALVVLGVWLARDRSRLGAPRLAEQTAPPKAALVGTASESATAAVAPTAAIPTAPAASVSIGPAPALPVVEGAAGGATLADVSAAVRAAIKTEARRCNPGRPITPAIEHHRLVFYFTQIVADGKVSLVDVTKVDSDLEDDRLERCLLARVADVRLLAPSATESSARLQDTLDLGELAP